ncbi:2-(3-amino-3-carboxypropyl)histidine synthase subunit 1 [Frankliniella fusca]|uniref:2-(3-amino-3-carboxypropyl)histidine synthase subunit 1 n=1 Tax=Frankliniella fusca TaxID=407009 RepID=A0AAE1LQN1_9NEOP|nr:2-(3-amino-3-carboxypropyl)histidine synthase subunit 1 [Frankliniella fusca]
MESTILVQHYAGHIAGENNFQRICVQCIEACHLNVLWTVISPSFTQYTLQVPVSYLSAESFLACGCCLEPCYIVLLQGDQYFGVESVPPEDVTYPHGLGRPEVPNHEAIVAELTLEMHRLSLQTSDPGTGAEDLLIHDGMPLSSTSLSDKVPLFPGIIAVCIYPPTPANLLEVVHLPLSLEDLGQR